MKRPSTCWFFVRISRTTLTEFSHSKRSQSRTTAPSDPLLNADSIRWKSFFSALFFSGARRWIHPFLAPGAFVTWPLFVDPSVHPFHRHNGDISLSTWDKINAERWEYWFANDTDGITHTAKPTLFFGDAHYSQVCWCLSNRNATSYSHPPLVFLFFGRKKRIRASIVHIFLTISKTHGVGWVESEEKKRKNSTTTLCILPAKRILVNYMS